MAVERADRLAPEDVPQVLALAQAAAEVDGTYPFAEHVVLHLRRGGDPRAVHLLARDGAGGLAGYAHVDTTDEVEGAAAELVVHPQARRRGLGRALATAALEVAAAAGRRQLRLWAHGNLPGAGALAGALGFTRTRVLHQLRRSLLAPIPAPQLPEGVALRAFAPGTDDAAWLEVNARAFADHPEQGRWTAHDLAVRLAEPWFDPAGFLLAVREPDGGLLGFHWTKVHGDDHQLLGEVYVLGVDPTAHGLGLGTALTLAGLRYLRGLGLSQAMLYVDEENRAAVGLYRKLGFVPWSVDVSFTRET